MIFTALPDGFHFTKVDPRGQKQNCWVRMGLEFKLTSESQAPHPFSHTVQPLCIPQYFPLTSLGYTSPMLELSLSTVYSFPFLLPKCWGKQWAPNMTQFTRGPASHSGHLLSLAFIAFDNFSSSTTCGLGQYLLPHHDPTPHHLWQTNLFYSGRIVKLGPHPHYQCLTTKK